MSGFTKRWDAFWSTQSTPLHSHDSQEYYRSYSQELRLLFKDCQPRRVLEIGCGDGALYEHLGFNGASEYKGVDVSQSMLNAFQKKHPKVTLAQGSGHSFCDGKTYDLIFSNGVIQYFTLPMLMEHFQHVNQMLAPEGAFVSASIPWRRLKSFYLKGGFRGGRKANWLVHLLRRVKRSINDSMGIWYDCEEFETLGQRFGMTSSFLGSMHNPYRFHVVTRRVAGQVASGNKKKVA